MVGSKKNEKILSLLFLRKGDQVLLAMKKRGFGEGRWNGVGGKVEEGESIEQATIRETQEEIGVTPDSLEKVADLRFKAFFKGDLTLMHVHAYFSYKWVGTPKESEEMSPKWFNLDNIPYDSMWDDDKYWLPLVIKGQKVSADFEFDKSDKVISHSVKIIERL